MPKHLSTKTIKPCTLKFKNPKTTLAFSISEVYFWIENMWQAMLACVGLLLGVYCWRFIVGGLLLEVYCWEFIVGSLLLGVYC